MLIVFIKNPKPTFQEKKALNPNVFHHHRHDSFLKILCAAPPQLQNSMLLHRCSFSILLPPSLHFDDLDAKGANPWEVLNQTRSKLGHHSAAIQVFQ